MLGQYYTFHLSALPCLGQSHHESEFKVGWDGINQNASSWWNLQEEPSWSHWWHSFVLKWAITRRVVWWGHITDVSLWFIYTHFSQLSFEKITAAYSGWSYKLCSTSEHFLTQKRPTGINWNFSGKLKSKVILNVLEFGGAEQEIKTIYKEIHAKVTENVRRKRMPWVSDEVISSH